MTRTGARSKLLLPLQCAASCRSLYRIDFIQAADEGGDCQEVKHQLLKPAATSYSLLFKDMHVSIAPRHIFNHIIIFIFISIHHLDH